MELCSFTFSKGDAYIHIPRTSTIATSATWIPSVRSLDCSDEALSKRLSTKCSDSRKFPPNARLVMAALPHLARRGRSFVVKCRTRPTIHIYIRPAKIAYKITKRIVKQAIRYQKNNKIRLFFIVFNAK